MKNEKGADKAEWSIVVKESRAAYRKPEVMEPERSAFNRHFKI